jgi:hypothetical protein
MKKNLEINVPRHAQTEVQREQNLKNNIFNKTRIATLSLILVVSLSVAGTLAYVTHTTNQTPNRATDGEIDIHIVENLNGGDEVLDTDSTFELGTTSKLVWVRSADTDSQVPSKVRISFMPQVKSKDATNASVSFGESWSALKTDANGVYISTDLLKLYINSNYADYWDYADGAFTSKGKIEKGQTTPYLLEGVTMADGINRSDYGNIKLNVIASAVQENATDAL